ncbi:Tyrosine recombinase XerC [Xanthomonas sacchari]|nr:Tyrosine recombinase XerC [Xanthomonas sacchari]
MAGLLYGSGMRLLECLRLRIKDVDLGRGEIVVRDGKGGKDRRVPLPTRLREPLLRQRDRALLLHAADLAEGAGRVHLPQALVRKYPNAEVEPGWQYLFPAAHRSVDPRSGRVGRPPVRGSPAVRSPLDGLGRRRASKASGKIMQQRRL